MPLCCGRFVAASPAGLAGDNWRGARPAGLGGDNWRCARSGGLGWRQLARRPARRAWVATTGAAARPAGLAGDNWRGARPGGLGWRQLARRWSRTRARAPRVLIRRRFFRSSVSRETDHRSPAARQFPHSAGGFTHRGSGPARSRWRAAPSNTSCRSARDWPSGKPESRR